MDYSLRNHRSFIGSSVSDLPTPALVISRPVVERNIALLLQDVDDLGIAFRPHVKTLKASPLCSLPTYVTENTNAFVDRLC